MLVILTKKLKGGVLDKCEPRAEDIGIMGIGGFRFLKYVQEYFKTNLKRFAHSRAPLLRHTEKYMQVPHYNSFN